MKESEYKSSQGIAFFSLFIGLWLVYEQSEYKVDIIKVHLPRITFLSLMSL